MKKTGAGLLVALVGGAAGVVGWKWSHGDTAELTLTCVPGQSRVYALSYASRGQMSDPTFGLSAGDAPEGQSVRTEVQGRWRETCVRGDATSHVLEVSVEDAKGQFLAQGGVGGGGAPSDVRELVAGQSYVELGADGVVKRIHFDARMSPLGQNLLRDMLSLRSMRVTGPTHDGATWSSDEEDANGPYSTTYTLTLPEEGLARISKGTRVYAPPASSQKMAKWAPLVRAKPSTGGELVLERDTLQPRSLRAHVEVELVASARTIGQSQSHLELSPTAQTAVAAVDTRALQDAYSTRAAQGGRPGDLAARDADARIEERIQREELGGDTWATLLEKAAASEPDRAKLFLKFKALFLLHPEACRDASALLATAKGPHELRFQLVAGALASAGTPEAQHALVAAVDATSDRLPHQRTLSSLLGTVSKPTSDTESLLRSLVKGHAQDEVRDTARLALGNVARSLQTDDPQRAERLIQDSLAYARSAREPEERVVALQALGNTGAPQGYEVIERTVREPDASLRQTGAAALRFMETDAAERLLLELASRDESDRVRSEAISALSFRTLSPMTVDTLKQRVRVDPSESVRQLLVKVLADEAPRYADISLTLEEVSRADASASVRKLATLVLLRLNASEG
ncbi:HEAT repeat domain-containing protein [Melittangium boletus]|uniref:HEAT repeat domain-containing protein n=1 Tax=Melittangium boletus TaxID=83453 RepID=UPI003DA5A569